MFLTVIIVSLIFVFVDIRNISIDPLTSTLDIFSFNFVIYNLQACKEYQLPQLALTYALPIRPKLF